MRVKVHFPQYLLEVKPSIQIQALYDETQLRQTCQSLIFSSKVGKCFMARSGNKFKILKCESFHVIDHMIYNVFSLLFNGQSYNESRLSLPVAV